MKTLLRLIFLLATALPAMAGFDFEDWTSKQGQTQKLKLVGTIGTPPVAYGVFKTIEGREVTLSASTLRDEDRKRLEDVAARLSKIQFENWTNKSGQASSMKLYQVDGDGDAMTGVFVTRANRFFDIKSSDLSEASKTRLQQGPVIAAGGTGVPGGGPAGGGGPVSVFDKVLEGKLEKLEKDKLVEANPVKPLKYYVFYYTASWCGPCQAFTPGLVDFYNGLKPANKNFEIVVISADQEEAAHEKYMKSKKVSFLMLRHSQVGKFQSKFDHGVRGIPALVVCDLEGKVVSQTRDLSALKKLVE